MNIKKVIKINKVINIFKVAYSFFKDKFTGENSKKVLPKIAYAGCFLISFVFFVILTFPYDSLKTRIMYEFSARQMGILSISGLSYAFPFGLKFLGMEYYGTDSMKDVEFLKANYIKVRQSLFSLFTGKIDLSFSSALYSGKSNGRIQLKKDGGRLYINTKNIEFGEYSPLSQLFGLKVTGRLNAMCDIEDQGFNISKSNGEIDINIENFIMEESSFLSLFRLPKLTIQSISGKAKITNGLLKVDTITLTGGDINGTANGEINLRHPFNNSILDLQVRFMFSSVYQEKLKSILDPLNIKQDPGGFYVMNIGGTAGLPRLK